MKHLVSIPLRVLLPLLLLSCVAIAGLISWKLNTRLLAGEIEAQFLDEAKLRITTVQATLEYHFRKGDANGVNLAVSGMATRNDVIAAYVLDGQDQVIAATMQATVGHGADAIAVALPGDLKSGHAVHLAEVRALTHGSLELSQDRRVAVAYYPLLVDVDAHALRSVRNGILVLVLDTQIAEARAFRAAGRQARDNALVFGGLAACAGVFIHLSLTRRVAGLVATTRQLAAGDLTARTGIAGNDELASVAKALDAMADQIAGDILRRQQVEAELRDSQERFSGAFEHAAIGVALVAPDGRWIQVNRALCDLVGYSEAELLARTFQDITHPEDLEADLEQVRRVIAGEIRTYQMEKRYVHARGDFITVLLNVSLVRDGLHQPRYFVSQIQDITERKRTEATLKRVHKELVDTSRRAGMAEVATSILHNVGNVLNSVNTSISIASDKVSQLKTGGLARVAALVYEHEQNLPAFFAGHPQGVRLPNFLLQLAEHFTSEQQAVLRELISLSGNLEHINEIVAMQQSYAGAGGVVQILPLAEVIEDALRMNAASFERRGMRIVREFDPALPQIPLDRHKLLLILVNLVRNARYACDECGEAEKRITVRAHLNGGGRARISVSDNGIGIPPGNLTRIFEHGFTTRKQGHGFGLHSSALAASEMGGSLRAHSDGPGCGATFTIELPLTPEPNQS